MRRQDRIGELGQPVALAGRVLHVRAGRRVVVQRTGPAHFAEPDVGACLVAVVEADEAAGLERLAERDRLRVAQAAVADRVVEPDVLDRARTA